MEEYNFTYSELRAYDIMTKGELMETNASPQEIHDKANELILLSEKIKAERAVSAMN